MMHSGVGTRGGFQRSPLPPSGQLRDGRESPVTAGTPLVPGSDTPAESPPLELLNGAQLGQEEAQSPEPGARGPGGRSGKAPRIGLLSAGSETVRPRGHCS